jgi:hypothetical protein
MAIIKDFNDENAASGGSGVLGGGGASTGGGPAGAPATPTGGSQGSGWTNLQSYLGANQGQAGGIANQITQDAEKQVDEFKKTDVSGSVAEIGKSAKTEDVNALTGDVAANASKAKDFLSSGYGGAGVDTYTAGIRNAAKGVKDTLGQVTNQGYQKSTLQKANNTPNQAYTSGFGALDSFLVSADPNAKAKLKLTQGRTGEVDQTLNAATGQISAADTAARSAFEANKQRLRDAAKTQAAGIASTAQGRVDPAKAAQLQAANTQSTDILNRLKGAYGEDLTDADLGLSSKYLTQNNDFGVSDVISDSEMAALNSLAGIDPTLGINPITKRGAQAATFNSQGFENELKGLGENRKSERARKAAEAAAAKAAEEKAKQDAAAREREAEAERWRKSALATNPPVGGIDFFVPGMTGPADTPSWTPPSQPGQVAIQTDTSTMAPQAIANDQPSGMVTPISDPNDPLAWVFNQ